MLGTHARVPGPRSRHPLVRAVRGLWTLPTTLFGHAMGLVVCRQRPRWVESAAAHGWLYRIPPGLGVLDHIGAVTLGHVVLHGATTLVGERGRAVLAHELAHTRQHDVLGPFYLPLHATAQLASGSAERHWQMVEEHDYRNRRVEASELFGTIRAAISAHAGL